MTTETETDKIAVDIIQKIRRRAEEIQNKPGVNSCIFRGEAQSDWGDGESNKKVSSSLYRMLEKKLQEYSFREEIGADPEPTPEDIRFIEKVFVKNARKHIGEKTLNIEVLSELQHYGGKTNLIDFTKDLHIALFFACSEYFEKKGRITILRRELSKVQQDITYPEDDDLSIKNDVKYILVAPTSKKPRAVFQSSIFVYPPTGYLDNDLVEKNVISICPYEKRAILEYLEKYHNINFDTIYNDIHGYIQNQKNDQNIRLFLGVSHGDSEEREKAIARYTKIISTNPQFVNAYFYRGIVRSRNEEHEKAFGDFTEAINLDPQNAQIYLGMGVAQYRKHESELKKGIVVEEENILEEAIENCFKAIGLRPQYATAYFRRALAYDLKGDYKLAIADFNKAIELSPKLASAYLSRGRAHLKTGNYKEALYDAKRAKKLYQEAGSNEEIQDADDLIQQIKDDYPDPPST